VLKPGGKGGNQAVEAARHGARTAMIGAVGNDPFGAALLANLRGHGVEAAHVAVRAEPSGMSVAISEPSGDYGAIIVSGVNLTLGAADVAAFSGFFDDCAWLVLQNEVPEEANIEAAAAARARGCRVMLNAAPARPLPEALAQLLDILVVNALEAETLSGVTVASSADAARAASALLALAPCAIVTAGGDGLAAADRSGWALTVPAHRIAVVSTHGAGDAFVGALAARLADGAAMADALRYANAAAALLVATPADARCHLGPAAVASQLEQAAAQP
jgi:ribokinase